MKKFKFSCQITVSAHTEVEAETLEEAMEIASEREAAIGGNGSGMYPDELWIIEDADGAPTNIRHDEG